MHFDKPFDEVHKKFDAILQNYKILSEMSLAFSVLLLLSQMIKLVFALIYSITGIRSIYPPLILRKARKIFGHFLDFLFTFPLINLPPLLIPHFLNKGG